MKVKLRNGSEDSRFFWTFLFFLIYCCRLLTDWLNFPARLLRPLVYSNILIFTVARGRKLKTKHSRSLLHSAAKWVVTCKQSKLKFDGKINCSIFKESFKICISLNLWNLTLPKYLYRPRTLALSKEIRITRKIWLDTLHLNNPICE